MTYSQSLQKVLNILMIFVINIIVVLVEGRIIKVNVRDILLMHIWTLLKHGLLVIRATQAVLVKANTELFELHYVTSQCASLIREDMCDLT
jgi:hypothetical protein